MYGLLTEALRPHAWRDVRNEVGVAVASVLLQAVLGAVVVGHDDFATKSLGRYPGDVVYALRIVGHGDMWVERIVGLLLAEKVSLQKAA